MRYHRFHPVAIGIEKNGIGLATLQNLQISGLSMYDIWSDTDKYSRAIAIATRYKAGTVYHRSKARWLEAYESELLVFPKDKNDDQVDLAGMAARMLVPVKPQQTSQVAYEEDYRISPVELIYYYYYNRRMGFMRDNFGIKCINSISK